MALDQASLALLQGMAARGGKPMHESTPEEVRANGVATIALIGPGPEMASVREYDVTAEDGGASTVRVLVPTDAPRGVLIYYHGGGWVIGSVDGYDTLGRQLAEATNMVVVLVEYRLAPEHKYPASNRDAWAALRWVQAHADELGVAGLPVVLGGDSAGGTLSIVTALRARDEGVKVDATVLVYPATDADTGRDSYNDPANQLLLTKASMEWFMGHYLGGVEYDVSDVSISPINAELAGFPPTALAIAEHDPLKDEGQEFGDLLEAAGVPVTRRLFEGQMHAFFQMPNILPAAREAIDWIAAFLDTQVFDTETESAR
ncbi:MAG: alpha/beta hydrolase [Microbacteriaceae bacterium]|nr:alpha/beta hydrolase [Microbacteriaceae bacterium]